MLRQHVLSFEKLHGGRCEDVRRFCNFIIHDKDLSGGQTPDNIPQKQSQATGIMDTPHVTLPGPDQSPPDQRPTPPTWHNGQYKEEHGQSPSGYDQNQLSVPPNTISRDWTTPQTEPKSSTQERSNYLENDKQPQTRDTKSLENGTSERHNKPMNFAEFVTNQQSLLRKQRAQANNTKRTFSSTTMDGDDDGDKNPQQKTR